MQWFGQVENGEVDWMPDGRCSTQESDNQQESEVEAAVKLLQEQVRSIRVSTPRNLVLSCDSGVWSRMRRGLWCDWQVGELQTTIAGVAERVDDALPAAGEADV
jgi:hypothetical protein